MATRRRFFASFVALGWAAAIGTLGCGDSTNADPTKSSARDLAAASGPSAQPPVLPGGGPGQAPHQLVAANSFQLAGDDLHVSYGPFDGLPTFIYDNTREHLTFVGRDITVTETPAGTLVTVVIVRTIDTGSTTFSVLIPSVEVASQSSASVATQGITTVHSFGIVPSDNVGQLDQYGFIPLEGTASHVEVEGN
jgi:hypothetical protein